MMPGFYYKARNDAASRISVEMYKGRLPRLSKNNVPCVDCGNRAVHYDHRDYAKPLEVEPVCQSCNMKRGRGLINGETILPRDWRAGKKSEAA